MVGTLDNSFSSSNGRLFGSFPFQCIGLFIHKTFFSLPWPMRITKLVEGLAQKPRDFAVRISGWL